MALPTASDNKFPKLILTEGAAPSSPAAGDFKLYFDSGDHLLKWKNSAGTVTTLATGSGSLTDHTHAATGSGSNGGGATLAPSTFTFPTGSNPTQTTEGQAAWDTDDDTLKVGDGAATKEIGYLGSTNPSDLGTAAPGSSKQVARIDHVHNTPGGSSSRPYIDTLTLHATYGDDFTGALNTGLWTRRTVTSGEETANVGSSNGWMAVDLSSGAASRLYLQTAPAGDFEIIYSAMHWATAAGHMTGPVIIDSTGAGVAAFFYNSAVLFYLGVMSGYAYSSFPQTLYVEDLETSTTRVWIGLKKSGTNYSARYSLNGEVWSPYTATSSQAFTVDRIGFGRILGTPTAQRMTIDRFNVI